MIHLTRADYRPMPWANGRGRTLEMLREDRPDGGLRVRLSLAGVVADGPFSLFPGVDRVLTVIDGPGFDLQGRERLRADPLVPVAFPGDIPIRAAGVTSPCEDFNVMTERAFGRCGVMVASAGIATAQPGRRLCMLALEDCRIGPTRVGLHDLVIIRESIAFRGQVVMVDLPV